LTAEEQTADDDAETTMSVDNDLPSAASDSTTPLQISRRHAGGFSLIFPFEFLGNYHFVVTLYMVLQLILFGELMGRRTSATR